MGFRIRKSMSLGKGVRVNFGKEGISTSVKIGNTTINSKGRVTTRLAPGVSYTTNLKQTGGRAAGSPAGRRGGSSAGYARSATQRPSADSGAKGEFKRGLDKLSGIFTFTVGTRMVTGDMPVNGSRRYEACSVESIPQPKGRKPHMAVKDSAGTVVFEVGAQARNAYAVLSEIAGWKLDWISWTEEPSYSGNGTFLRCRVKETARVATMTEPPIPRIVIDTETTGLHPETDEILQLAIIDGAGNVLHNRLYRPSTVERWPEAQRIHGITPATVADRGRIEDDRALIQSILDRAQQVCVYNADFDLAFLGELRLRLDTSKVTDTMRTYGRRYHRTDYYKLEKAARECGYRYHAHDTLADCHATLAVQSKLDGKPSPWRTAQTPIHSSHIVMTEDDRKRMKSVAKTARMYDAAHSVETPASAEARRSPEGEQSVKRASKAFETTSNKPVSRLYYWSFVVLVCVLGALSAVLALVCIVAPYMLIMAIPAVLLTFWGIKECGRMKKRIRTKRRRH